MMIDEVPTVYNARPRPPWSPTGQTTAGNATELAEGEGFEPPVPEGTAVFKTAAFVRSATPPAGTPS